MYVYMRVYRDVQDQLNCKWIYETYYIKYIILNKKLLIR